MRLLIVNLSCQIIVWKVVDTPNPMGSKSKRAEYKVVPVCGLDWMGMKVLYTILHGLSMDQNRCLSRMITGQYSSQFEWNIAKYVMWCDRLFKLDVSLLIVFFMKNFPIKSTNKFKINASLFHLLQTRKTSLDHITSFLIH